MDKWKCKYCKQEFKTLFDRDSHHRTHVEHYRMLFEHCLGIIAELRAVIEEESLNSSLNIRRPQTAKYATFTCSDCGEWIPENRLSKHKCKAV